MASTPSCSQFPTGPSPRSRRASGRIRGRSSSTSRARSAPRSSRRTCAVPCSIPWSRSRVTFAVAGDPLAARMATALGGTTVEVPAHARAAYHAAATIAANHVVALLAQVERVARQAGVPLEAFVPLARAAVEDAGRLGPERALTGPVARGDWQTVERHVRAIDPDERAGYLAGVELARVVAATASRDGLAAVGAAGIA